MSTISALNPAQFLASADINGKPVSFFTPPHSEPDLPWVDLRELALAVLPEKEAEVLTAAFPRLYRENGQSPYATAVIANRSCAIISHLQAQAFAGMADTLKGISVEEDGPEFEAYWDAFAEIFNGHVRMSWSEYAWAVGNIGGPFGSPRH
jgi:hypothetical protein